MGGAGSKPFPKILGPGIKGGVTTPQGHSRKLQSVKRQTEKGALTDTGIITVWGGASDDICEAGRTCKADRKFAKPQAVGQPATKMFEKHG